MTRLSPEARRLLQLARSHDDPSPASLRRAEHSLALRIARGVGATAAATLWAQSASGFAIVASKVVAIAALAGATTAVGYWALPLKPQQPAASSARAKTAAELRRTAPLATPAASNAADVQAQEPKPAAEAEASVMNRPAPRALPSLARVEREVTASADRLREETQELRVAQQALRRGNAVLALDLLSQQDQTYPDGVLQQERSAARVLALCESGQKDLARAEARRFEQRWPKSPLVARLRSACL